MAETKRTLPTRANDGGHILHGFVADDALEVLEVAYPGHLNLPLHTHDRPCLTLVLEGSFVETINGQDFDLKPGHLLVKPAHLPHSDQIGAEGVRSILIEIVNPDDKRLKPFVELLESPTQPRHIPAPPEVHELLKELREPTRVLRYVSLWAMVLDFLVQVARQMCPPCFQPKPPSKPRDARHGGVLNEPPPWLSQVLQHLEAQFPETPPIEELATNAGVHPAHMCRAFKKALGCSVGTYVRRLRLNRAADLLSQSDQPLIDIAVHCGFYDQSHFCRLFRRSFGMTPRAYRSSCFA